MLWFFGLEVFGILVSQPGIEQSPPTLEGKVLTTGPAGKFPLLIIYKMISDLISILLTNL